MIAEDVLDRYLVRLVERKTQNPYVRALVRGGANPGRSFANVISGQLPWVRPGDQETEKIGPRANMPHKVEELERKPGVAPLEFAANAHAFVAPGGTCAGGGASAAFRVNSEWQIVLDVNGCKMTGLTKNLSGDSLTYMVGLRWTLPACGRLLPYVQVLFGGNRLTQELILPDRLAQSAGSNALIAANTHGSSILTASPWGRGGTGSSFEPRRGPPINRPRIYALLGEGPRWLRRS
jgi:hypothetical protein